MKTNYSIRIRFIFSILLFAIASTITVKAQLPTVYFNKVYTVTSVTSNSATITTALSGSNFRFIGDVAGTNGIFQATGSVILGKLVYVNTLGNNVIYIGELDKRKTSGNNPWGFVFTQTTGGTSKFFVTNPAYESNIIANSTITSMNSGNSEGALNDMRNNQVVLTTSYFVSNFTTCLNTASSAQTFTVSGSKLVSDVTVTAPTNFEVSKDNSTYSSSISFTRAADNTLATSTVYLRMKIIASAGSYSGYVVVSATNAASQDLLATGDVNATTAISTQPRDTTVCSGNASTFSVTAAGASLTYQWKFSTDGTNYTDLTNTGIYTGATTSVLRLSSGVTSSYTGYKYKCTVTGSCGSAVTSNVATLTINSPITISSSPSNSTICAGNNTTFSVTATGTSPTYQWKESTNGGSNYNAISNGGVYSGATSATLTITGATAGMNSYKYLCVVSGTCANATSDAATLTINAAPSTPGTITGNSTICSNTNQSYSIAAVSGATSYTWTIPSGWTGTSTTNSINVVNSTSSGTLQVSASNSCGSSVSSSTLAITVSGTSAPTPAFTINNQEQCLSNPTNSFVFTNASTAASGTTISSYLWNFGDGSAEASTTDATKAYAAVGSYVVSLKVTASNGCISSINKQVVVNAAPTGQISGSTSICSGSSASLTITLTGQGPWLLNYTDASSPISISSSPYTLSVSPTTTTIYYITSLSDSKCSAAAGNMTGSATVTVNSNVTPAVTISSSDADNSICSGNSVTFSSSGLSNQGASPSYQWLKNGVAISLATSSSYTTTGLANNDVISLQLLSNSTSCLTTNTVISNTIQTQVNPGAPATPLAISGDTTQCTSLTNQVYSITSVLNASTYTWVVPAGWTINSGNGTTSIVATIGSSSGTSSVTVTAGNGCGTSTEQILPVAVSSSSTNPISLTSASGTDGQTSCINSAITNIVYSSSGGTSATFSGLPTGVSGSYSSGTITISGTPSVAGTYNYTITLTGGGCDYTKTGTITVTAANTAGSASSSPTLCISTALTTITHTTTGATGIGSASNLPSGVSASWSSNTITISGTPTQSGTFNYSIPLSGGCSSVNATGTIVVSAAKTITLGSGAGSNAQTICLNSTLGSLSYTTTGETGTVFSGLPSGVSGSYSSGTSSISGTPSVAGTYNYTVTTTGGCGSASASGSITVNALPSPATISSTNGPICAGFDAQFSISGTASAVLTYNINAGSNSTVTLNNGNGNGTITAAGATSTQTLALVSIQDASTLCVTSLSATSTISIRSDDEWTAKGNSDVYHTSSNWCKNGVPGSSSNIVIPVVSSNKYPKLTAADAEVASIQINSGANLDLNGRKFVINGSLTGTGKFTGHANATLEFTGSGDVGTIYMDQTSSDTKTVGTLKINRSSGGVLTLGNNMTASSVDLTAGKIDIGNNDLTVGSTTNASSSSYVKVSGTGKVKGTIGNSASLAFPVGKSAYNPITITNNAGASDEFSINLLDEVYASYDATTGVGTTPKTGPRVTRTWNIGKTNANGGSGINLTFNWNSGEVSGTINTPALYHFESGNWVKQTGTTSSPTATSFTFTGYTGTFSPFAIGDANINLPVTWLSFTATKLATSVQLDWTTASEVNAKDFVIEYSNNTIQWLAVGVVPAAGNTTSIRNYIYIHQNPLKGNNYNYYRILQRDVDGKFSYSKIVSIIFNEPGAPISLYPNPAHDNLTVFVETATTARLLNAAGATIWRGNLTAGRNQIAVNTFSKGVYLLATEKGTFRVVIQ